MLDQIQEYFAMLTEEQKYTLLIVVAAIIFVVWKIAKSAIRIVVIVGICLLGYYAYTQFAPSGIEKAGKKVQYQIDKTID
ncbi:hypothetical protein [Flammeovirga kamogawensis]|uniref:Uncharacterized protein n=1 Tax=Flammeovirga kamogawensis TaxID=373891 RepID=A0ABX8GUT7_9BACT|nr:hypothetical protein [Flammeovirga kamogawensis]MBB6464035.1 uncharacterized membrane protein YbaN (DUF454 family) [Flammeovirga kamogawensis]QWG07365.1 hypothetical protein KM029_00030 [Flammeovirga kamogawensis]TRX69180.1 hypothetical protein EO216_13985 [Flammeovirga kamogawensis]